MLQTIIAFNSTCNVSATCSSVEATTLNQRNLRLLPQDRFLRDNITSNDVLIVSIGGNDIALAPTPCTIVAMAGLLCLPYDWIENGCTSCAVPVSSLVFSLYGLNRVILRS